MTVSSVSSDAVTSLADRSEMSVSKSSRPARSECGSASPGIASVCHRPPGSTLRPRLMRGSPECQPTYQLHRRRHSGGISGTTILETGAALGTLHQRKTWLANSAVIDHDWRPPGTRRRSRACASRILAAYTRRRRARPRARAHVGDARALEQWRTSPVGCLPIVISLAQVHTRSLGECSAFRGSAAVSTPEGWPRVPLP